MSIELSNPAAILTASSISSSVAVPLPIGLAQWSHDVAITNVGSVIAYVAIGATAAMPVAGQPGAGYPVLPGQTVLLHAPRAGIAQVSAVAPASTLLYIAAGAGGSGFRNSAQALGPQPTVLLADGFLAPSATFSRLSSGTYFDSTPLMQTAAAGVPRWDHDPATGAALGLLMEAQDRNYTQNTNLTALDPSFGIGDATLWGAPTYAWSGQTGSSGKILTSGYSAGATFPQTIYMRIYAAAGTFAQCGFGGYVGASIDSLVVSAQPPVVALAAGAGRGTFTSIPAGFRWLKTAAVYPASAIAQLWPGGSGGVPSGSPGTQFFALPMVSDLDTSFIPTSGATATRAQDILTFTAPPATGTLLIASDAPAGTSLINTGGSDVLVSQGPGEYAIAFTPSGTTTVYNGGSPTTGPAIAWRTTWQALANAVSSHVSSILQYPDALSGAQLQALTA